VNRPILGDHEARLFESGPEQGTREVLAFPAIDRIGNDQYLGVEIHGDERT
jgi:hypothetical protein